jgi:hypothetical protein
MSNFNDHYTEMIEKNIDSLSTKIAVAVAAGESSAAAATVLNALAASRGSGKQISTEDARKAGVAIAASQIYQTIAPDVRCWRLLPDNYQLMRFFVEPGEYSIDILPPETAQSTWQGSKLNVQENDFRFFTFHTLSDDRQRYRLVGGQTSDHSAELVSSTLDPSDPIRGESAPDTDVFARRSVETDVAGFVHFLYAALSYPMNIDEAEEDASADTTIFTGDVQQNVAGNFGLGFRYHAGLHGRYDGIGGPFATDTTVLRFNGELEARYTIWGQANQGLWAGGGFGGGLLASEVAAYELNADYYDEVDVETDSETYMYGIISTGYRAVVRRFSIHPYISLKFGKKAGYRIGKDDPWVSGRVKAGIMMGWSY